MNRSAFILALFAALVLTNGLRAEERTLPAQPGENLRIDMRSGGSVEVQGTEAGEVKVEWDAAGRSAENIQVDVQRVEKGVRVASAGHSLNLRILVPRRFNLDLHTSGGNIKIADVEGKFDGQTMGGNIVLNRVKGGLSLSTRGGNISMADSDMDGIVTTMGGSISLKNVAGNTKVSTMGGHVTLDNVVQRGGYSIDKVVEVSTMGGNISVANAPRGANVSTQGGNVVIDKSSDRVEARTMGGNITLGEHGGQLIASTMGGDVKAVIVPGSSNQNIDISSMGGRIDLTLPADFSGVFDLEIAYTRQSTKDYQIVSDFPVRQETTPEWDQRQGNALKFIRGTGTAGGGANKVKIRTVNGNILIKKK